MSEKITDLNHTGSVRDGQQGRCYLADGTDDYIDFGSIGGVLFFSGWVKLEADNQELFTLANSTATALTVTGGVLTAGASITLLSIRVDGVSKTASEAGVILNDNGWHFLSCNIGNGLGGTTNASNLRFFTDSSAYGNVRGFDWRFWDSAPSLDELTNILSLGELGQVPNISKISLWIKGDEQASTTAYDSSGNSNNGTIANATLSTFHATQDIYSYQNNVGYNRRMYFDGSDDGVALGDALIPLTGDFTISYKTAVPIGYTPSKNEYVVSQYTAGGTTGRFIVGINTSSECLLSVNGSSVFITGDAINDGELHTISISRSGNTFELLIDGVSQGTGTYAGDIEDNDTEIGKTVSISRFYEGLIWDVNINDEHEYQGYGNTDADWVDQIGSNDGTVVGSPDNIYIPRDESDIANDVFSQTLENTGVRPNDGALINSNCLTLNGTNQFVEVSDNTDLDISDNLTVCCWAKNDNSTLTVDDALAGKWEGSGNLREWIISIDENEKLLVSFGDPNDGTFEGAWATDSVITMNQWHHYAFTFNNGTVKIYVDGVLVASSLSSGAIPSTLFNSTSPVSIGAVNPNSTPTFHWDGQIADVRIYSGGSTVLSESEILSIYQSGAVTFDGQTLAARYKLQEGSGYTNYDSSDNNNPGIIQNAGSNWGTLQDNFHANLTKGHSKRMYFDGTNDYVSLPSGVYQAFSSSDDFEVTVYTYYNGVAPASTNILFGVVKDDAQNYPGFNISLTSSGTYSARVRQTINGIATQNVVTSSVQSAGFYKLTLSYAASNSQVELLINDVSQGTDSTNSLTFVGTDFDEGNIGALGATGAAFDGFFDGVVFDVTFSKNGAVIASYEGYGNTSADWVDQVGSNNGNVNGSPALLRIPSSDITANLDAIGATLSNPAVDGHNNAESKIDFDPDSTPEMYNIYRGAEFNGSSDYVQVTDNTSFDITSNLTASVWFKHDSVGIVGVQYVFGKYDFGNNRREWAITIDNDEKCSIIFGDPSDGTFEGGWVSDSSITINEWGNISFTYTNNPSPDVKVYLNGVEISGSFTSGTIPSSINNGTCPLSIGCGFTSGAATNFWDGQIQYARIYKGDSTVLTDAQIAEIYNKAQTNLAFPGQTLIVAYPLAQNTLDTSGNNLHGQNSGVDFNRITVPADYGFGDTLDADNRNLFKRVVSTKEEDRILFYEEPLFGDKQQAVINYTS